MWFFGGEGWEVRKEEGLKLIWKKSDEGRMRGRMSF